MTRRKLLKISLCCWPVVFGILIFASDIESSLISIGFESPPMLLFKWTVGLGALIGGGVPFYLFVNELWNWVEEMKEDSSIYNPDQNKSERTCSGRIAHSDAFTNDKF